MTADFEKMEFLWEICSNYNHKINYRIAKKLKEWGSYAEYPWRNFFWRVWYEAWEYRCEVMQYRCHVDTVSWKTFKKVKDIVCEKYGFG